MKKIAVAILSPLVIGSVAGILIPLYQYQTILGDAEASHGARRLVLERLPTHIVIGCVIGLAIGVLTDLAIRRLRKPVDL